MISRIIECPVADDEANREVLTSWSALCRHRENRAKLEGYRRFCADFGIDFEALGPAGTTPKEWHWQPRLIFAEQPGNWFYPDDVLRSRLLDGLLEKGGFDSLSGPLFLVEDAFGHRGWKRCFIEYRLGFGLGPVSLVGSSFLRRYQGHSYGSLRIAGNLHARMAEVFEICDRLLTAADSPHGFSTEVSALLDRGVRSGLRGLLPTHRDRHRLERLGWRLAACESEPALATLRALRGQLVDGVRWSDFWHRANSRLLGTEIGRLETLVAPFVLAIRDPWKTARALAEVLGVGSDEPVPLAGVVTDENHYRLVCCDRQRRGFFLEGKSRPHQPISWDAVREYAAAGRCGGPSVVLKYILMAARGLYLVADPLDGATAFERQIARLHRHYTGLGFPWVALRKNSSLDSPGAFLDLYRADFEPDVRSHIDDFLNR